MISFKMAANFAIFNIAIRGLIPRNFAELAEAVPIDLKNVKMTATVAILSMGIKRFSNSGPPYCPDAIGPILDIRKITAILNLPIAMMHPTN